jgi:putative MATE family efflux protein
MTQTELLFPNRRLWSLIWPIMIEQLLSITLGMAAIIMISTRGEAAVSGVSLVDTVFILLNGLFTALATGGAVVCSQYIGYGKPDMASRTAIQLLFTVTAFAALLAVAGFFGSTRLLALIFGNIDADVMENARVYFHYMLASLPGVAVYNGCAALFRSQGNSRVSMMTELFVNVVNVSLSAFFLFGLGWGVQGVAVPNFVARTLAAAILLFLLLRRTGSEGAIGQISIRGIRHARLDGALIGKILRIGVPNGLENSVFQLGKILVLTLVSTFGTGAIAANAVANTVSSFEVLPASSISIALLTVVGQCMGAGRPEEAARYVKKLLLAAYIGMAVLNVPLLLVSKHIVALYGLSDSTAHLGWMLLMLHGTCGILFWPASFTLPNALRAAADVKYTMIVSLVSMWVVRIGFSYVFALVLHLGVFGVWMAMICDWLVRDTAFIGRFVRGKWKTKRLVN